MPPLKTRACSVPLLLVMYGCQCAPVASPTPLPAQVKISPAPAWAMEPPADVSYLERMRRILSISSPGQSGMRRNGGICRGGSGRLRRCVFAFSPDGAR